MIGEYNRKLGEIADILGAELDDKYKENRITEISSDSRELGALTLFVPLVGEKFDGHTFVEFLCRDKKIAAYLTSRKELLSVGQAIGIPGIYVSDTLAALAQIGREYRLKFNPLMIGLTGTNGKTTTKELLWTILNHFKPTHKNVKNYNNEIGVPFTLLQLNDNYKQAVIEMGMNHLGEIDRLTKTVLPDMALITNVGEGHLEFLGTLDNVAIAKSEIMHGLKKGSTIFLNADSNGYNFLVDKANTLELKVISYGLTNAATYKAAEYSIGENGVTLKLNNIDYAVNLYGLHNIYNLLSAVAVALELGYDPAGINEALTAFENVGMRSQIIRHDDYLIINDTYNANPLSTRAALSSLGAMNVVGRRIAILSDMKELGDAARECHLSIGHDVVNNKVDLLYTWGDMAELINEGAENAGMLKSQSNHAKDKQELISNIKMTLRQGDVVLIKGSRSMKMEEVVDGIIH